MDLSDLRARAERWAADDPDLETAAEIRALVAASNASELAERFAGPLEFGTAGLRGLLGAGPNRMNRAVVARTTHGLAEVVHASVPDAASRGVVVGYDGRRMSRELAEDTAAILTAAGLKAYLFEEPVPTPLTAFAVARLGAAAGVMITASHNPPEYNGYKVYWESSAQIISPVDGQIAAAIDKAPAANKIARPPLEAARAGGLLVSMPAEIARAYLDAVRALSVRAGGKRSIAIVYTPMHGVGDKLARQALAEAGFTNVASVPEQQHPDGAFPTVRFPNPEEPGAMDLALALARKNRADLVLANDPDADRLAVAIPHAPSPTGYFQLTGNQVGVLLGHYLLTNGRRTTNGKEDRVVLASVVSSPMLGRIAQTLGVHYEETLTGFKWIANRAMALERTQGSRFVFGYEEALGYTVGDVVRDKDGVSAAVMMAELAAILAEEGRTLLDALEDLYRTYGLYGSTQVNVTRPGAEGLRALRGMMEGLRRAAPRTVGDYDVVALGDYAAGTRTELASGKTTPLTLPKTNMLAFELLARRSDGVETGADPAELVPGSRIIARPSGTEPKVKFYFDLREKVRPGEPMDQAEERLKAKLGELEAAWKEVLLQAAGP